MPQLRYDLGVEGNPLLELVRQRDCQLFRGSPRRVSRLIANAQSCSSARSPKVIDGRYCESCVNSFRPQLNCGRTGNLHTTRHTAAMMPNCCRNHVT